MRIKNIQEKKSHLFAYLRFVLLLGCGFILLVLLVLLVRAKKLSSRQFSFLNGPRKGINVFMWVSTFIPL